MRARASSPGSATRRGRRGRAGPRAGELSHRRCGGSSPAPPIRAGDRVWDAGRSVGEWTPPRVLARARTRQAWRSRSRGRHRRLLAGPGRCARGTWPAIYERPRTEHTFCKGNCRHPWSTLGNGFNKGIGVWGHGRSRPDLSGPMGLTARAGRSCARRGRRQPAPPPADPPRRRDPVRAARSRSRPVARCAAPSTPADRA